ncbi:MAG TPA: hypothetical protein VHJ83_02345 [Micromonosporaceae bacterium]|nr:hypothetical protein [Micromonosporaceae bacterium]
MIPLSEVGYTLTRVGVLMSPDPDDPREAEGVLNPATGRTRDGRLWLLPRMVAAGNVSRVGLAEIVVTDGVPSEVRRERVVLEPDEAWERGSTHAGVEDPRITWLADLGQWVMSYVAYGPLGPRPALAVSVDLARWRRLGPLLFGYQPKLGVDLNLFSNKDVALFPEPVRAPDGTPSYAVLHRPTWDLSWIRPDQGTVAPPGVTDNRPGIWVSFAPVAEVVRDVRNLVRLTQHRQVALPAYPYESLRIGAGPPPVRVPEGWLLIHHGVSGRITPGREPQRHVHYSVGAMLLDADDVTRVIARTENPLLRPELAQERTGTVANVVFPTAIEEINGARYVFYGMADAHIGVARLDRCPGA